MRAVPLSVLAVLVLVCAPERGAAQDPTPAPPPAAAPVQPATPAPADSARRARPRRSSRAAISREEIEETQVSDALALIQRLRPSWLRRRGSDVPNAAQDVVVYQDNFRRGYAGDVLKEMQTSGIRGAQYFDPINARMRFGPGHEQGVIMLIFTTTDNH